MYRLLIVDDEAIARESVYGLLATQNDMELELLTADSAVRAVSILETERVDIAIMDINMPQMTGLELYEIVREKWPQCKVIFLTGYSEFDYVYKVHTHARYVLKADREEVLLEAVRDSIQEIENDMIIARVSDFDPGFKQRAGLYRSSCFIVSLLEQYTDTHFVTNEILRDMNITLDIGKKMFVLMLDCEEIASASFERGQLLAEKVSVLSEKYFLRGMRYGAASYKNKYLFLMLQWPEEVPDEIGLRRLEGYSSLFQSALQLNAAASVAVLIAGRSMYFEEAIACFGLLYDGIAAVESGDTQILTRTDHGGPRDYRRTLSETSRQRIYRSMLKLDAFLESSNQEEVLSLIREIKSAAQGVSSMHDLFLLEIYCRISTLLLKVIQQYAISEQLAFRIGIMDLYNISSHHSWEQAFSYLEKVVNAVFDLHEKKRLEQQEDLVVRVQRYIQSHLSGDTSLTGIADYFHFSREYLLRVFKKETGVTILQYINDLKAEQAKELLQNPDLPVKEIAQMLGFGSTSYFIRFFKSKVGLSPKLYRENPSGRSTT